MKIHLCIIFDATLVHALTISNYSHFGTDVLPRKLPESLYETSLHVRYGFDHQVRSSGDISRRVASVPSVVCSALFLLFERESFGEGNLCRL